MTYLQAASEIYTRLSELKGIELMLIKNRDLSLDKEKLLEYDKIVRKEIFYWTNDIFKKYAKHIKGRPEEILLQNLLQNYSEAVNLELLNLDVQVLGLSQNDTNRLKYNGYNLIGDLVSLKPKDLLKKPYIGRVTLRKVENALLQRGLTFEM